MSELEYIEIMPPALTVPLIVTAEGAVVLPILIVLTEVIVFKVKLPTVPVEFIAIVPLVVVVMLPPVLLIEFAAIVRFPEARVILPAAMARAPEVVIVYAPVFISPSLAPPPV